MMDFTPFYYTYSTIAQTLASAFAFLTAVFLMHLPELMANLQKTTDDFQKATDEINASNKAALAEKEETPIDLTDEMGRTIDRTKRDLASLRRVTILREQGAERMENFHAIGASMRLATSLTAGTIAACLVLMPMTTVVANSFGPIVAWGFLILPVASALTCLWLYWRLLVRMLGTDSKTVSGLAELASSLKKRAQRTNSSYNRFRQDLQNIREDFSRLTE